MFGHAQVVGAEGGDLRKVGDAEHLHAVPHAAHELPHAACHRAADSRVDLVKNDRREVASAGHQGFEREHQAGDFTAGGRFGEIARRHAGIGREEEGHGVGAGGVGCGARTEIEEELRVGHAELREIGAQGGANLLAGAATAVGELRADAEGLLEGGAELRLGFGEMLFGVVDSVETSAEIVGHAVEFGDGLDVVFALQGVEFREAAVGALESHGIDLDTVGQALHIAEDVVDFDARALQTVGEGFGFGAMAGGIAEVAFGLSQAVEHVELLIAQARGGMGEGALDVFGVGEGFAVGFEARLLVDLEGRTVDLLELETEVVAILSVAAAQFLEFLQAAARGAVVGEGLCVGVAQRGVVGHEIEGVEEVILVRKEEILVLRVDVDEVFGELSQHVEGGRRVVDESAALACGRNLAADEQGVAVGFDFGGFEEGLDGESGGVEGAFDDALGVGAAKHFGIGAMALEQTEGAEDDALTGAGFAGDDGEIRAEIEVEAVDEGVVADVKVGEHGTRVGRWVDGRAKERRQVGAGAIICRRECDSKRCFSRD